MTVFIVTIRLPKIPSHDPHNKLTNVCRHNLGQCTDATGEHHSFIVTATNFRENDANAIKRLYEQKGYHVTRVEVA